MLTSSESNDSKDTRSVQTSTSSHEYVLRHYQFALRVVGQILVALEMLVKCPYRQHSSLHTKPLARGWIWVAVFTANSERSHLHHALLAPFVGLWCPTFQRINKQICFMINGDVDVTRAGHECSLLKALCRLVNTDYNVMATL